MEDSRLQGSHAKLTLEDSRLDLLFWSFYSHSNHIASRPSEIVNSSLEELRL